MDLETLCFLLFGVLLLGFLLLEGFDYGVGMLLPFLGKSDLERQAVLQSIVPVWEGNEVWVVAAGAVLFAGFPHVYATLFSGLYLPLFLLLMALIIRDMSVVFRNKATRSRWRHLCDWLIFTASTIAALLWGVAIANFIAGIPINEEKQYVGTFFDLLSGYTVLSGITFLLVFLVHGAGYLMLKLEQPLVERIRGWRIRYARYGILIQLMFVLLMYRSVAVNHVNLVSMLLVLSVIALYTSHWSCKRGYDGCSFASSGLTIVMMVAAIFSGLYPRMLVSGLSASWSLDIYNASSGPVTLKIMTTTMLVLIPLILAYQGWMHYLFRQRISVDRIIWSQYQPILRQMNDQFQALIQSANSFASILEYVKNRIQKPPKK